MLFNDYIWRALLVFVALAVVGTAALVYFDVRHDEEPAPIAHCPDPGTAAYFQDAETLVIGERSFPKYPYPKSDNDMFDDTIPNGSIVFAATYDGTMKAIFLSYVTQDDYTSARLAVRVTYDDADPRSVEDPLTNPRDIRAIEIQPRKPDSALTGC